MMVMAALFLGSALLFALIVLYGESYGEVYLDSQESLRQSVARHRVPREQARLARDHG